MVMNPRFVKGILSRSSVSMWMRYYSGHYIRDRLGHQWEWKVPCFCRKLRELKHRRYDGRLLVVIYKVLPLVTIGQIPLQLPLAQEAP